MMEFKTLQKMTNLITCLNGLDWIKCTKPQTVAATFYLTKVSKDYESMVMPSYDALVKHCERANYVLGLFASISKNSSTILNMCNNYGWTLNNGEIEMDWGKIGLREIKLGAVNVKQVVKQIGAHVTHYPRNVTIYVVVQIA